MLKNASALLFFLTLCFLLSSGVTHSEVNPATITPATLDAPDVNDAKTVLTNYHRDSKSIDDSIEILETIIKQEPENVEALNFLSRVWLTYGYAKARTKEDLIFAFENGVKVAKKAIEIAPENPDSHFFYVANLASLGDAKGVFNSLFMLPEIRRELEIILELDPNHAFGLAMNGALYSYLPGILGGDTYVADVYIRRSLSIKPNVSSAKLYLARNLRKQKKYDEAIDVLLDLVNDKEPYFYPDWYLNSKYAVYLITQIREEKADSL